MSKFQNLMLITLFLVAHNLSAQNYKFGKVSKDELQETYFAKDSSAVAAVLYRSKKLKYEYFTGHGFKLITDVYERIKIYNKEGFKYAIKSQLLYKNSGDKETISGLKAFTYNLENGSIAKSKMQKSSVFSTSLNDYRNEDKFTLPNIKEGSVIEFEYKVNSPFYYYIDEIVLQYDIPIKVEEIAIETPEYFVFKPNFKGHILLNPVEGKKFDQYTYTYKSQIPDRLGKTTTQNYVIDYAINTVNYSLQNVPALKKEPFVNDMDNYRSAVDYELQYVDFPQQVREHYSTTWEEVIKKIYNNDSFGDELKISKYYKEDLEVLSAKSSSKIELVNIIFEHIKKKMSWNGNDGYYAEKGLKNAYKENVGNIADINLILTSMLQSAGLDANPILVSTRDNGIPVFPTREGFNYVIASVQLEGGIVLLDATNDFTKPNLLPTRALNWFGKLIKKDGTYRDMNLIPKKTSKKIINVNIALSENGDITGKGRTVHYDYYAYLFRNKNATIPEEEYLEKLENKNEGMEISNYLVKNKMIIGKPIIESFELNLEAQADVIGDKIYFAPLFYMALTENPFKLDERVYPIDYTYPWQEKYAVNIELPEGYKLDFKPEDVNIGLVEGLGSFKYQLNQNGNSIQMVVDFKMNQAVIGPNYYADLKELFKNAVEKQTEKVVLSKI